MVPRVLLLTGVAPGRVGVGSVFLRDLCMLYPRDRICCFHTTAQPEGEASRELDWLPIQFAPSPREHGINGFGQTAGRLIRPFLERCIELSRIRRLVSQATRFGKTHHVDLVWATLHTPTTHRLAKAVADSLHVPLVCTVWDPPANVLREVYRLDRYTLARLLATFERTVRFATRCGVASDNMRRRYEQDFGTQCITMIYGAPRDEEARSQAARPQDGPLIIGFAGGIYAREEWGAFLAALASRDWRVAGRDVVVRVLGVGLPPSAAWPVRMEFLGWRDRAETVRLLAQTDLAYLPYGFDDSRRQWVQLSFPGKLADYAAAGVPVLYHGPIDSSVMDFLQRFPMGCGCHSVNHDEIVATLERLVTDTEFYRRAKLACNEAYHEELSASVFRKRFAELIGVREDSLLSAECTTRPGA